VHAALEHLPSAIRTVLIHDAARPFVPQETIDTVLEIASSGTAVVPGIPVSDTLKRIDPVTSCVTETVDRSTLWRAQTPQGFPRAMLEEAYRSAGDAGWQSCTDEAALVEEAGFQVKVVPDRASNIKVTTPDDFAMAQAFLAK